MDLNIIWTKIRYSNKRRVLGGLFAIALLGVGFFLVRNNTFSADVITSDSCFGGAYFLKNTIQGNYTGIETTVTIGDVVPDDNRFETVTYSGKNYCKAKDNPDIYMGIKDINGQETDIGLAWELGKDSSGNTSQTQTVFRPYWRTNTFNMAPLSSDYQWSSGETVIMSATIPQDNQIIFKVSGNGKTFTSPPFAAKIKKNGKHEIKFITSIDQSGREGQTVDSTNATFNGTQWLNRKVYLAGQSVSTNIPFITQEKRQSCPSLNNSTLNIKNRTQGNETVTVKGYSYLNWAPTNVSCKNPNIVKSCPVPDDNFSTLRSNIWNASPDASIVNNKLQIVHKKMSPTAGISTQYQLKGDFDVQVTLDIAVPGVNDGTFSAAGLYVRGVSQPFNIEYRPAQNIIFSDLAPDRSTKIDAPYIPVLRLARIGTTAKLYDATGKTEIASANVDTNDVTIELYGRDDGLGNSITAQFSDFRVNHGDLGCGEDTTITPPDPKPTLPLPTITPTLPIKLTPTPTFSPTPKVTVTPTIVPTNTPVATVTKPRVTTTGPLPIDVTSTTVLAKGEIISTGGEDATERGFIVAENASSSNRIETIYKDLTGNKFTSGAFSTSLKLNPDKYYSVQAYAINSQGKSVGVIKIFKTPIDQKIIIVHAKGTSYFGTYAKFQVYIDNVMIGDVKTTSSYSDYVFKYAANLNPSEIRIRYYNDFSSRDLYVDRISVDGKTYTTSSANYSTATISTIPTSALMKWGGSLKFEL